LLTSAPSSLTDIVAGRFDAGIRPGERVERDMIAVRIGEEMRGVLVAAPDYLARHPRPTSPRDLETHSCIRFRFPSGVIAPWQFERKGKQVEVAVDGRFYQWRSARWVPIGHAISKFRSPASPGEQGALRLACRSVTSGGYAELQPSQRSNSARMARRTS
jgi:hypothetical protein